MTFKNKLLLIREYFRGEPISRFHLVHSGVNLRVRTADELLYWPRMTSQIIDDGQSKEALLCRELFAHPLHIMATDFSENDAKR